MKTKEYFMNNLIKDERGSLLPIMAAIIVFLIAMAALAPDVIRFMAGAEKLKTASDSAAVAGALSATRYVRLHIDPGSSRECCGSLTCSPCCVKCGDPFEVTGKEKDLIDNNGWRRYCCSCGCGPVRITDRWVEYKNNNAQLAAEMFFDANIPKEMSAEQSGSANITGITTYQVRNDPRYPSVVVRATGTVKTIFLDFLNKVMPGVDLSYITTSKCSQGGTYYYDLRGKYHKIAEDACD